MARCLLAVFAVLPFACAAQPDPGAGVSLDLARARARTVSDVRYRLTLTVRPKADVVLGSVDVRFRLHDAAAPVVLDFRNQDASGKVLNGKLTSATVNGSAEPALPQANGHIVVPAARLREGENLVALSFESAIAAAGRPYIRYLDRDDGSEYVYTLLVPMDASLAFPCFDQPDLKGRFTLELVAPDSWNAVSNAAIDSQEPAGAGLRRTRFAETKPISTYLFAFAAGPFQELRAPSGSVPYRLLARRSKFKRAQEEWPEVLRITDGGMKHLTEFFDYPFPFPKYDQVLIPGLAYGGMEHAGATFLREEAVLFRTTPTASDLARRSQLLLHELTHQWFGDLVTMRWFDDLWLKEGFATYMGYHAEASMEPPGVVWKRFYEAIKPAAYAIDETKGTTPIHQELKNLLDAKSAYGAIVYSKAPGLLRYLSFTIGETAFRDGLRTYLKRHQWSNATWDDLISALSEAAGRPLDRWADAWVNRRGMPEVTAAWDCDTAGRLRSLSISQHDVLDEGGIWPIRTRILLAYDGKPPVNFEMMFSSPGEPVLAAAGKPCPVYVFLNDEDKAYGRFMLDARSRLALLTRVGAEPDALRRALLWGGLWDAVRQVQMPPVNYVKLAVNLLPSEMDEESAQTILSRMGTAYRDYLSQAQRTTLAPKVEQLLQLQMHGAGSLGLRITYFRSFASLATTESARGVLKAILAGKDEVPGLALKPADRWRIVTALVARGDPDAERLLREETARDTTDDGRRFAYVAAAARRDAETKRRYFDDYRGSRIVAENWLSESLGAFNAWDQTALTSPYLKRSLELLPVVKQQRKIFFLVGWLTAFVGGQHSAAALSVVDDFLKQPGLDADLRLKVLQARDDLDRTVRIRSQFAGARR